MNFRIEIETRLGFAEPVREHHAELKLVPRADEAQTVVGVRIATVPESRPSTYADWFGNRVDCFDVTLPHDEVVVRAEARVETRLDNPFAYAPVPGTAEAAWLKQKLAREPHLLDYVLHQSGWTPPPEILAERLKTAPRGDGKGQLIDAVIATRDWVSQTVNVEPGSEDRQDLLAVLDAGTGRCGDLAHLLVALVRGWGVPARYVSGFEDIADEHEDRGAERDAPHAWAEVLIPGAGWRGFDPVYELIVNDHYVAVAVGRDAADTAPLKQVFKGDGATAPVVKLLLSPDEQKQVQTQEQ